MMAMTTSGRFVPMPEAHHGRHARAVEATRSLARLSPPPRPERLSGIHNPWGLAAGLTDCWVFLDLCQAPDVVAAVTSAIGPDVILWDAELHLRPETYRRFVDEDREGRYWPADPLAGALALLAMDEEAEAVVATLADLRPRHVATAVRTAAPLLVARYMPATSRYRRDLDWPANRRAMEECLLVNAMTRPLWLVSGTDRAGNDFVTGFAPPLPRWAGSSSQPEG